MREKSVILQVGWLIDGSGAAVQSNMRIGLHNGIIRSIRTITEPLPATAESEVAILDLSNCTLLPGLIDSHVHLALPPTANQSPPGEKMTTMRDRILTHLNQYVTRGILCIRDGGDPACSALHYKADQRIQDMPVDLKAASMAYHRPGRYGHLIGRVLSLDRTLSEGILQAPMDGDHIKIVNSGLNSMIDFGKQTAPQFDANELDAAVKAARQRGFKIMVHANGNIPVKLALDAQCDSIEHGFFMGTANMEQMAASQTIWVPTVHTMQALKQRLMQQGENTDVVQKNLDHQIAQIQRARELGVRIALGTDAGSTGVAHGQALIKEMRLFLDAGYPIEKVIECATQNGALLVGLSQAGRIKKDLPAHLIAVSGPPSQLPESLEDIEVIYHKGNKINSKYKKIN